MPFRIRKGDPAGDAWLLFHQTYDSIIRCEEVTFAKVGMLPQSGEDVLAS